MSDLEEVVSKARVGAMLVGNLPELPGYNGSRLIINDIEAERVSADVYAALEALQSRIKELESSLAAAVAGKEAAERDAASKFKSGMAAGMERAAEEAEKHFIYGHAVAGPHFAAKTAAAIRALKGEVK